MRLKMWLVASTLVLFGLVIAPAASAVAAPAADPECNYGTWVHEGAFQQFFPSHHVGNAHNFRCELREGDFNNFGVVALQNTLIRCYGQAIAPDSDFGPKTEAALKNAQRIHGLPATGVYNWTTHITIFWPTYLAGADIDDKFKCQASF